MSIERYRANLCTQFVIGKQFPLRTFPLPVFHLMRRLESILVKTKTFKMFVMSLKCVLFMSITVCNILCISSFLLVRQFKGIVNYALSFIQ